MIRILTFTAFLLSASASYGHDAPYYGWKFEKFYGMCLISIRSIGDDYRLTVSSISPEHVDTQLLWTSDIVQPWKPWERYDVDLVFDNSLKSTTTGVVWDEDGTGTNRMGIGNNFNFEALGQHDLLELYVDDHYVAAFPLPGASAAIRAWISCTIDEEKQED